jgi:hypothetical protein
MVGGGAVTDDDWKTTGGRLGLEERRGRRPAVGETGHSEQWRKDGGGMEIGAEENEETLGICFYTYLTSWPTSQFRFAGIRV